MLITEIMAFMSYNPTIARVLEKKGVKKFELLMSQLVSELPRITRLSMIKRQKEFDKLHKKYMDKIIKKFTRSKNSKSSKVSYGQAQKPINVFLKLYVDWAKRPNSNVRKKILCFLHVPLDKILMHSIKNEYLGWYSCKIKPKIKNVNQPYSLSKINMRLYNEWQKFFREKYPNKPLIFDLVWALNRNKKG